MRQLQQYPKTLKDTILTKALAPNGKSTIELANEFNVPYSTVYAWVSSMKKNKKHGQPEANTRPKDRKAEFKLQAVIDTLLMTEDERGAYCRKHAIYTYYLDEWKKSMLAGLNSAGDKERKEEHQQTQDKIKKLKSDLSRKEKALAEVSALLILKKKADLLWGEDEDD